MRVANGRVSSDDLHPKPKPRTLSFWYTREKGCLCHREKELQNQASWGPGSFAIGPLTEHYPCEEYLPLYFRIHPRLANGRGPHQGQAYKEVELLARPGLQQQGNIIRFLHLGKVIQAVAVPKRSSESGHDSQPCQVSSHPPRSARAQRRLGVERTTDLQVCKGRS